MLKRLLSARSVELDSQGSALLAVLITSSILGALAYMTLFSLTGQQQSMGRTVASSEFTDLIFETQTAIRIPANCLKAVSGYAIGGTTLSALGFKADGPLGPASRDIGFSPGRTFNSLQNPQFTLTPMTDDNLVSYGLRSWIIQIRVQAQPTGMNIANLPFSSMISVYWSLKLDGTLESCQLARFSSDGRTVEERTCATRYSTPTNYFTYDPVANTCVSKVCPPTKPNLNYKTGVCS